MRATRSVVPGIIAMVLMASGCVTAAAGPTASSSGGDRAPSAEPPPEATASPSLTPGHGQYVLVTTEVNVAGGGTRKQAWLVKPDGSGKRMIAQGPVQFGGAGGFDQFHVAWSHDGTVVHVNRITDLSNPTEICVPLLEDFSMVTGATSPRLVMTGPDLWFAWSPDDSQIAYGHLAGGTSCYSAGPLVVGNLMVMNPDGTSQKTVLGPTNFNRPRAPWSWTAQGDLLVYSVTAGPGSSTVTSSWKYVDMPGGQVKVLDRIVGDRAQVAPGGTWIVFASKDHRALVGRLDGQGLFRILGDTVSVAWSHDSKYVALDGDRLAWRRADSGLGLTLYEGFVNDPSWSPDDSAIAFVVLEGTTDTARVVSATGGSVVTLPVPGKVQAVSWQP